MNSFTEKSQEIIRLNAEIINNLNVNISSGMLARAIEILVNNQNVIANQIEQNTETLENLVRKVNNYIDDEPNTNYSTLV
jgi:hypothetical protein